MPNSWFEHIYYLKYYAPQLQYPSMFLVVRRLSCFFSKMSRPKPKPKTQELRSFATGDEKAAKLSKSEQQQQNKMKAIEQEKLQKQTIRHIAIMKTHTAELEEFKTKQQLDKIKYYQHLYLAGSVKKISKPSKAAIVQDKVSDFQYLPIEPSILNPETQKYKKFQPVYGNYTSQLNSKYELQEFEGKQGQRRVGTLGMKLGMTMLWDRWGDIIPATIIQLDRVQIVQIKQPTEQNPFCQVQMGIGEKRIKNMTKPQIGHFLKANVPPKHHLAEFAVSKQCLLPVGYMISARHYTPGMFVDISGKTVGHGFSGTIKKYGFKRQPASHGNSLTTRVLGSTGGRQDPGRVFKQKKMYGRMGGKVSVQRGMTIFRIDVDKNILYIKGSIPGKAGSIVKISDTLLYDKAEKNLELSHFPTFVEEPGVKYARIFSMYCGERDPEQIQIHDNAFIIDDGEEAAEEDVVKDKDLEQE